MPTCGPISGAISCHSGCSVVGFSSKRIFPPLTVARLHSAPSLHGRYPLPGYYGLSDSRQKNISRVSQVPRLFYPHALPSTTPESSTALLIPITGPSMTGFIRFDRLATLVWITRLNQVRLRCGSRVCLARLRDGGYSHFTRFRGLVC